MAPLNPTIPEGDGYTDYGMYEYDEEQQARIQAIIDRVSQPDWLETHLNPNE